jgi:DNA-binding HxlR family transcriptional regulator
LRRLLDHIEASEDLRVVVFDSAVPGYFIAHFNLARGMDAIQAEGVAPMTEWPQTMYRFATAPVLTVGKVHGRARGIGSEFLLALDIRYASLESAVLGQPEVGVGLVPIAEVKASVNRAADLAPPAQVGAMGDVPEYLGPSRRCPCPERPGPCVRPLPGGAGRAEGSHVTAEVSPPAASGDEPACSIERSLQVLGERWTLLVLREVFSGRSRFADIQASLGVATNLLTARLRTLVDAGVLESRTYQEPGSRSRQSYHLTKAGKDLRLILAALQQWGDVYRPRPSGPSALRRTRPDGRPVHVAFVTDDGDEVPGSEVMFLAADGSQDAAPAGNRATQRGHAPETETGSR